MSELNISLLGIIQIVCKGELPQPLAYGLLILLIGTAIRIARPSKTGGLRQLLKGVWEAVSLIRGTRPPPTEEQPKQQPIEAPKLQPEQQPQEAPDKTAKKPVTGTVH
jgi:hypothetical protein